MGHVLIIVLASLAIPAIALAVIAGIERRRREPLDGIQPGDTSAPPEFEVSAQTKVMVDTASEEPRYRERAG